MVSTRTLRSMPKGVLTAPGKSPILLIGVLSLLAVFLPVPLFAAGNEAVLYSFKGGGDGLTPSALIFDASGNLYGTTIDGGNYHCNRYAGCGTVFRLSPRAGGGWSKTILWTFGGADGANPEGGLIFDSTGSLYGTSVAGGAYGTVFKLTPNSNGTWNETNLHSFEGRDGSLPAAKLVFDTAGNLYGTTQRGGLYDDGTIFKIAPATNGRWKETVLHSFNGADGANPASELIMDSSGNLYGTTVAGGDMSACLGYGCGTVFELERAARDRWKHKILHSFKGKDGEMPCAGLVFDGPGNLYGTTNEGGDFASQTCLGAGCGTVFMLTPSGRGNWTAKVLHKFHGWTDGFFPYAPLILDAEGNLYGTTWYGSNVFKLTPRGNGSWIETVLHTFNGRDGSFPAVGLIFDRSGNLYGTTDYGGKGSCHSEFGGGCGVVFEIRK